VIFGPLGKEDREALCSAGPHAIGMEFSQDAFLRYEATVHQLEQLVEQALHLVVNGERAPGGDETWDDWARRAEMHLRKSSR